MDERLAVGLRMMMLMVMKTMSMMTMMMMNGALRIGSNLIRSWFCRLAGQRGGPISQSEDRAVWLFKVNSESISYFMYQAEG